MTDTTLTVDIELTENAEAVLSALDDDARDEELKISNATLKLENLHRGYLWVCQECGLVYSTNSTQHLARGPGAQDLPDGKVRMANPCQCGCDVANVNEYIVHQEPL